MTLAMPVTRQPRPQRVLLVLTPWASPYFPGLSVALLRSVLLREGLACDLFYANLLFSRVIDGNPLYEEHLSKGSYAELAFTPHYFDSSVDSAVETLHRNFGSLANDRRSWSGLIEKSGAFLDLCLTEVRWEDYDIVGFSLMFQQTLCSLALARRIKQAHPGIKIVFGGPSCAAPMGREFMRNFPEIDYVLMGEADEAIAPLVRTIRERPAGPFEIPGVIYRRPAAAGAATELAETGAPRPIRRLDDLPIPDYGPYFEQVERQQLTHFDPYLFVENSRGCWWGEKHHCTFCGIDDEFMVYRAKSPERILDELVTLSRLYRRTSFLTADNILNQRFYTTLLPRIKDLREKEGYDFTLFFELKSNITRSHAQLLRESGVVQVQPGIESFSDEILALMDKGATGIQQMFALKCFAEFDIGPIWNIIYMNPNERPESYRGMLEMIPAMHHVPPLPRQGLVQMLLQRFNPYFEQREKHGIKGVRAQQFYRELFPRDDIDFENLAFFFDYERSALETPALAAVYSELKKAFDTWRDSHVPDSLLQFKGPGFIEILDGRVGLDGDRSRVGAPRRVVLEGLSADVFSYCGVIRSEQSIMGEFRDRASEAEIRQVLDGLIAERLVYRGEQGRYLNLPLLKAKPARYLGTAREQYQPSDQQEIAGPLSGTSEAPRRRWEPALAVPRAEVCCLPQDPAALVEHLFAAARRERTTFLDVVGHVLDRDACGAVLPALCARQLQEGVRLSPRWTVRPDLSDADTQLLLDAGVDHVRIQAPAPVAARSALPVLASVLERIDLLRSLAEARIEVSWELNPDLPGTSAEDLAATASLLERLAHLPPPALTDAGPGALPARDALVAAVERWRARYSPDALTYSQGPGFVRILDARPRPPEAGSAAGDRLVTLAGAQSEIFRYCTQRRSLAELTERFAGRFQERQLSDFLGMLEGLGFATSAGGAYLSLPVHRKIVGIG